MSAAGTGGPVPGPPRGRSRRVGRLAAAGDVLAAAERDAGGPQALAVLLKDVAWLAAELAADPRMPGRAKAFGSVAVALAVWPRAPLPAPRSVVRLAVGLIGVRHLLRTAGYGVVYEHWRGTDEGLALVLALAGVEE